MTHAASLSYHAEKKALYCYGNWTLFNIQQKKLDSIFKSTIRTLKKQRIFQLSLQTSTIASMDSSGAWQLYQWQKKLSAQGFNVKLHGLKKQHFALYNEIQTIAKKITPLPPHQHYRGFALVGKKTVDQIHEVQSFLHFIGKTFIEGLKSLIQPAQLRFNALVSIIENTGLFALGIIALLSFMIGIVLTYQMGFQLKNYGASLFVINLLGLAILREFAPLLTAIMVAGRSGSSFTAQLGLMKIKEEIDALKTMGVLPSRLLILPRIFGLTIALPLLTIWADLFGILGGMAMTHSMLHIGYIDFLRRFPKVVELSSLVIGIGKTPVFALIIASIACFQGLRVRGSADSVGKQTTRSVVQSIFFIIVADALFSILFSTLNI
ncbi:MAG: ABC transporter permease [Rickettsiella sp.]|nr:ABC transporter permease [Rickettsiella sp.]